MQGVIISAFDPLCNKILNDTTVYVFSVFQHYFVVISLKSDVRFQFSKTIELHESLTNS